MANAKAAADGIRTVSRFAAWGLALFALGSAFVAYSPGLAKGLSWALCLFSIFGAGVSTAQKKKPAFIAYAAIAVLFNPFVPFHFPPQVWRLLYAGAAVWLIADHLEGVF